MMPETEVLVGGWTMFSCEINRTAMNVFNTAFEGFVGVKYIPVAVASQLVSGTNYSFFCNSKAVYPNAPWEPALVDIYAPLEGDPHITQSRRLQP